MDASKSKKNPNPREKANIISVLFWWWTVGIFRTGYRKVLGPEDLFIPLKNDHSSYLGNKLETNWMKELEQTKKVQKKPSLLKTIFRTFLWDYFLLGLLQILNEFVLRLGTPILLGGLLRHFREQTLESQKDSDSQKVVYFAVGICVATFVNVITLNQGLYGAFHVGGRIRAAVCSVVYRKALKLSVTALGETAPGKIVNLVANDVNRFDLVSVFIHHMWSAPLSALIIGYILYTEAGLAGVIGIAAVFIVVPIQSYTGKLSSKFRLQTALRTDERIRLMDEIISGVQVIKMYAWEKPFSAMVELARKLELRIVMKSSYIRGVYMTFNLFTTRMALYCTLVAMLLMGDRLTADKVFVFSSYFNILAHTMSGMFVRGFAEIAECMVAVRRLQNFLTYEEFQGDKSTAIASAKGDLNTSSRRSSVRNSSQNLPFIDEDDTKNIDQKQQNGLASVANDLVKNTADLINNKTQSTEDTKFAVNMENVCAKWESEKPENILDDISLKIEEGKSYLIIGMVGAGKTSLLSAILGEINITKGSIKHKGTLSYASQESWVFGSSVRQNILFGHPFDRHRYQKVVKACALNRDFLQFPDGDQTIVGDRGSSLSGGQKARINLARCLYKQADIYVLDDPLSAVDAHVSKHLFEECLVQYLRHKTRILATHQLQFLPGVDGIILVEHGKTRMFSNHMDLLAARPEYGHLIATDNNSSSANEPSQEREFLRRLSSSSNRSRTPDASYNDTDNEESAEWNNAKNDDLIEATSKGAVKGSIFLKYFKTGSGLFLPFITLLMFILTQCTASLNDLFVPHLIDANINSSEEDDEKRKTYIYIYSGIVASVFLVGLTRSIIFYKVCMRCNQRLHDLAFGALIRTGMRFFDTNPSGRILNRFSKDLGGIDEWLPKTMLDAAQINLWMVGSLIVACTVNIFFIIPIVVIGMIFYWIRKIYLKTSKNIKRLEGTTKSPVFTHLNATLNGLTTIRAYGAQEILKKEFDNYQDTHTSTWYMFIASSTAFGFALDVFSFIFTTIVIFSFILLNANFSGSEVGLAITQVMAMTGLIQWGMRQSAEVSNQLMSVERVLEYSVLQPEDNLRDPYVDKKMKRSAVFPLISDTPKGWPSNGLIRFTNVSMRYAEDMEPVLRDLNLIILPGEKVGIVGRTGAGKSSLISALFRLAKVSGAIEIDNVDTGNICLEDLRSHISIIPQDPFLFSGTIRRNLDPFNEYTDENVWMALEEVELKEAVVNSGGGLESRVLDRGSNYSVGQRQLVCLARAILRNNRILMLDEATANVDPQTDSLIQRTIRTKFATCTVLTVAHRLNTIMDSDKVLVMDKGCLKEYDHPHVLLEDKDSAFTSMVKETGSAMHDQLARVAKKAYMDKYENR